MTKQDIRDLDSAYLAHTYNRFPVVIASGRRGVAKDIGGKKYIDFGSGIGANSLGFSDKRWRRAVIAQLKKVQHTSNLFYTLPAPLLAERLCLATGYRKVFLCNSGAEANEGAIKLARKWGSENKDGRCSRIVTLENSFHGRTITTLAATGQESFRQYFQPFTEGFSYIPANDIATLENALADDVCAVLIEFVQGEGGVCVLEQPYVDALAQICRERNILFMADEVQTGIGRTGTLLACEQYGIKPDVITLAKGLGAGFPIGAILMNEKTENVFGIGQHGTTFGGNPVVCAGAIEALRQINDQTFLASVREKAEYMRRELSAMPGVTDISGLGLMFGLTLREDLTAATIARRCAECGLLILTAKKKLRILPPLNISWKEIQKGLQILKNVLR